MTWPQALHLGSRATPHHDVYFNLWRLRWFAHAMITPSAGLFDGNIFHPEPRTLAYSDAMIVEGIVAAPLLWAGLKPVLVHNLLLLGAIAASGMAMCALARYLTGSLGAGVIAGVVFAFAPYRFEHIMHMELQWTMWMPLAFLALHRTFDTGQWKYGLATGACVALADAVEHLLRDLPREPDRARRAAADGEGSKSGAAAGAVAAGGRGRTGGDRQRRICRPVPAGPDSSRRTHRRGSRELTARRPSSYLAATPSNWLYGGRHRLSAAMSSGISSPGSIPVVLAIVGLLLQGRRGARSSTCSCSSPPSRRRSGSYGHVYPWLYDHVRAYRGLRAPARLGVFVLMFLAVLAPTATRRSSNDAPALVRAALVTGADPRSDRRVSRHRSRSWLSRTPLRPSIAMLARQPRGVVAELPMPALTGCRDARPNIPICPPSTGSRWSTDTAAFIRRRISRGSSSSGDSPTRRRSASSAATTSPTSSSTAPRIPDRPWPRLRDRIAIGAALVELGAFDDGEGPAVLYRMR